MKYKYRSLLFILVAVFCNRLSSYRAGRFTVFTNDLVVKRRKAFRLNRLGFKLTFPYPYDAPTFTFEGCSDLLVPLAIRFNLILPELHVGRRQPKTLASFVTMPKATVDEYDGLIFRQNNVGFAWQFRIDPETQTLREQEPPNQNLRFGILALDGRHATAPLLRCHYIRHAIPSRLWSPRPNGC